MDRRVPESMPRVSCQFEPTSRFFQFISPYWPVFAVVLVGGFSTESRINQAHQPINIGARDDTKKYSRCRRLSARD